MKLRLIPNVCMSVIIFLAPISAFALENPFEDEIIAFENEDRVNPPPAHPIVFVGSSSFRMWETLEQDFKPFTVLNRGFGGSELSDVLYYADRIIVRYDPKMVVVYAGDNDLAAGKTPEQVVQLWKTIVSMLRSKLPRTPLAYVSIKPSPAREHLFEMMKTTNERIGAMSNVSESTYFIDVFHAMLDNSGKIREELFLSDGLHMNDRGYALWLSIIKPFISDIH